jgi:predicted PurR-regulated permease PerM
MIGMFILQMPYALMISIMVGVINMIPMVGAFIGGGIGVFLIFTVSPIKALVFLVFLCIIQQIESNVFFPRIVGNKVGLPGIYVMITIVVGGSLAGVAGMILGVPLVASIYKLAVRYFQKKAQEKEEKAKKEQTLAAKPKIFTRG